MEGTILLLEVAGFISGIYFVAMALTGGFDNMLWWNPWKVSLGFIIPLFLAIVGIGLILFHNPDAEPKPTDMSIYSVNSIDSPKAVVITYHDNVSRLVVLRYFLEPQVALRKLLAKDILSPGQRLLAYVKRDHSDSPEYVERFYVLHNRFDQPEEYLLDQQTEEYKKTIAVF